MREELEMYEAIDRYLNKELQGKELEDFVSRLNSDEAFSELVQTQKAANEILAGSRLSEVKQMMDADFEAGNVNPGGTGKWWLGGLSCISVLAIIFFYSSEKKSDEGFAHPTLVLVKDTAALEKEQTEKHIPKGPSYSRPKNTVLPSSETPFQVVPDILFLPENIVEEQPVASLTESSVSSEKKKEPAKENLCHEVSIRGELSTLPSCEEKNDGILQISGATVKGGLNPYTFILIDSEKDSLKQQKETFNHLAPGNYTLIFQDKNNCVSRYPIEIGKRKCGTSKAQSFSPAAGETFKYPVATDAEAAISIYNASGRVIYTTRIAQRMPEHWEGTEQNGQQLPAGLYIYIIEYSSGQKETGEVIVY